VLNNGKQDIKKVRRMEVRRQKTAVAVKSNLRNKEKEQQVYKNVEVQMKN
jgi:hypothetical protein